MKLIVLQKVVFSWIRTHVSESTCNRKQCNINARFSRAKKPEIVSLRGMLRKNFERHISPFLFFICLFSSSFLPSSPPLTDYCSPAFALVKRTLNHRNTQRHSIKHLIRDAVKKKNRRLVMLSGTTSLKIHSPILACRIYLEFNDC